MGELKKSSRIRTKQLHPGIEFETRLWEAGFKHIGGLDEAGRGAWAGPVGAAVVVLPNCKKIENKLSGVRDSKKMTPRQRNIWAEMIKNEALAWGLGFAGHDEIDEFGIVPATKLAMQRALEALSSPPDFLLIDAVRLTEISTPQTILIRGDSRSLSIASASVLAKTERDKIMVAFGSDYPEYGFARHKGYGTALHRAGLEKFGITHLHRKSYAPIKELIRNN